MQMGQVTLCRFNRGKSLAFCVTHERLCSRSRMKGVDTPLGLERVPWLISHLYPPRVECTTVPLHQTIDARGGQHTEPSWSSLCANGEI